MLNPLPIGVTAVVPVVTDHAVYASAATTMLYLLRHFILPELDTKQHASARHYALELQFILAQIEDVEKHRNKVAPI